MFNDKIATCLNFKSYIFINLTIYLVPLLKYGVSFFYNTIEHFASKLIDSLLGKTKKDKMTFEAFVYHLVILF